MKQILTIFILLLITAAGYAQVVVSEDISANTTWTVNNEYHLDGLVFVNEGVTLTIESGTVIKGLLQSNITTGDGASALVVRRGAKLIAEGTQESPIIFTSELDDLTIADDLTKDDRGLWGGLILLGNAVTNQPTTENQIEGIPNTFDAKFGGTDDTDNSGVLKYISIRHGGFSISGVPGDEINGLTMGAVGSGTTIEHIEVFANFDDGYEWFGGTVSPKYLVAAFCGDDAFDYDMGWRGKGQFWFSIQSSNEAGRGGEHDGGDDDETGLPYAIPVISNVTYIGSGSTASGVGGDGNDRVIYFRDNAGGKYYNSIFTDFVGSSGAITIEDLASGEDSRSRLEAGELVLSNNYFWGIGANNTLSSQDFTLTYLTANGNTVTNPELRGISREANEGLDPRPAVSSSAATSATQISDGFFTNVSFLGAFNPADGIWTENWTALSSYGFTPTTTVGIDEEQIAGIPTTYSLDQNYPNPFNPATTIRFSVPEAANVKLRVYNILGQQVAELINGFRNSGTYNVNWNAENLTSGVYIYRLEAGANVITKKMTLLK